MVLVELAMLSALLPGNEDPIEHQGVVQGLSFSVHCDRTAPALFDQMVVEAATEFGVDPRIVATTVYRESDCYAEALGSSGEIGLGQVHPRVWVATLVKKGILHHQEDLWDPQTNLRATAFILACLHRRSAGDLEQVFRRYNGSGPKARAYAKEQLQAFSYLWGP